MLAPGVLKPFTRAKGRPHGQVPRPSGHAPWVRRPFTPKMTHRRWQRLCIGLVEHISVPGSNAAWHKRVDWSQSNMLVDAFGLHFGRQALYDVNPPDKTPSRIKCRNATTKILIIGSGPIVIGVRFTTQALSVRHYVRMDSDRTGQLNPATIMTDPEMADHLY